MSHSSKNLRDVKDVAPDAGFGEIQEARFARRDLQAEQTGLAYHVLRPASARASRTATTRRRRSSWCSRAAAG